MKNKYGGKFDLDKEKPVKLTASKFAYVSVYFFTFSSFDLNFIFAAKSFQTLQIR
jgi:hypothetical protein